MPNRPAPLVRPLPARQCLTLHREGHMRAIVLGAVMALAGCATDASEVSGPIRAEVGMSVDEYRQSCRSGSWVDEWFGLRIGQCIRKPTEYAEFKAGYVVAVYGSETLARKTAISTCEDPQDAVCLAEVEQYIAEHESDKAEAFRKRQRAAAATAYAPARAAPQSRPALNEPDPVPALCFFRSEYTSGQNKICNYDCNGSITPKVQQVISICMPMASP